jgi:hypothetical protein
MKDAHIVILRRDTRCAIWYKIDQCFSLSRAVRLCSYVAVEALESPALAGVRVV